MKYLLVVFSVMLGLAPTMALADEDVQPHLFDDLNGNGVSDQQEQGGEHTQPTSIEDITLPDTPPDDAPAN